MEGIRKRRIKENSFETDWTLHLYSFLGFTGHFMPSSGLREVLENIYGRDAVPYMV